MAYRGITDPFTPKTTRNERFAQMSKQEQLIEQKKREIQAKLEEQKKKEADEALKKFQSASGSAKSVLGSKSNPNCGQHGRNARKSFWKSHEQRWKKENQHVEDKGHTPSAASSVNIFSNDGSFLDQFKKLSGVKEGKPKKDEDTSTVMNDLKASNSSSLDCHLKIESDTDWGTWGPTMEKQVSGSHDNGHNDKEHQCSKADGEQEEEDLQNSDRLGTSHWFQSSHAPDDRGSWQGQADSPPHRSSSPYSPTRATTDTLSKSPDKPPVPVLPSQAQFPPTPIHPPPSISLTSAPPPPILTQQPVQQFLPYTAPPPPILTIPPPAPLPSTSVPPPAPIPATSIPPPQPVVCPSTATMNLPHPASILQHSMSTGLSNGTSTLAQQLIHPPPPIIQQHAIPPAPLLPPQSLGSATISHTIPPLSSMPVSAPVIQPSIPPPPLATPVIPPLMGHHIPPPGIALTVPGPVTASLNTPSGTGVSPAAPAVDPSGEEATTHLARMVAQCGDDIEEIIKVRNPEDQALWFLHDKKSTAYIQYRCLVDKFRAEMKKDNEEEEKGMCLKKKEEREEMLRPDEKKQDKSSIIDDELINEYGSLKHEMYNEKIDENRIKKEVKQEQVDDENSRQSEGKRSGDESDESTTRKRKRRSRWAPESDKIDVVSAAVTPPVEQVAVLPVSGGPQLLTKVVRTDPALIQYAMQAFGTSNLSEDDWKKAEDHYKINLLYQDMMRKRQELERLQRAGKFKYEYDSDEETDGGTWEHRLRLQEMEATQLWAEELTKKAEGKHHIGDFLPPDELERFMEKYSALKEGREPDLSDYKEFKLKEDNIGFQMLQKLGWTEGQGLGSDGLGITDPVNKASSRPENQGLGLERPEDVSRGDDEYDAYRKRMMLAYRFRPNPLNNPRRPYY